MSYGRYTYEHTQFVTALNDIRGDVTRPFNLDDAEAIINLMEPKVISTYVEATLWGNKHKAQWSHEVSRNQPGATRVRVANYGNAEAVMISLANSNWRVDINSLAPQGRNIINGLDRYEHDASDEAAFQTDWIVLRNAVARNPICESQTDPCHPQLFGDRNDTGALLEREAEADVEEKFQIWRGKFSGT